MTQPTITTDTFDPDGLFAGHMTRVIRDVTIESGQTLSRGAVLGRITANGKYVLSLSAAIDGSEVPAAILADDVDAGAGDKDAPIFETGEFNETALTLGTGHTIAGIRDALRDKNIHLKSVVAA